MKKQVLMCAPFNTRSGYGDHARSIFYSIMDREDFEIKCVDVRWGDTPRNHLDPNILPENERLLNEQILEIENKLNRMKRNKSFPAGLDNLGGQAYNAAYNPEIAYNNANLG